MDWLIPACASSGRRSPSVHSKACSSTSPSEWPPAVDHPARRRHHRAARSVCPRPRCLKTWPVAPEGRKLLTRETTARILLGEPTPTPNGRPSSKAPANTASARLGVPIGYCQCVRTCFETVKYEEHEHFEGANYRFAVDMEAVRQSAPPRRPVGPASDPPAASGMVPSGSFERGPAERNTPMFYTRSNEGFHDPSAFASRPSPGARAP